MYFSPSFCLASLVSREYVSSRDCIREGRRLRFPMEFRLNSLSCRRCFRSKVQVPSFSRYVSNTRNLIRNQIVRNIFNDTYISMFLSMRRDFEGISYVDIDYITKLLSLKYSQIIENDATIKAVFIFNWQLIFLSFTF